MDELLKIEQQLYKGDQSGEVSDQYFQEGKLIIQFFLLSAIEYVYLTSTAMTSYKTALIENTVASSGSPIDIPQDPKNAKAKTIYLSDNERSGIEFSYSFFLYVNPDTFDGSASTTTYKHIFHKGYKSAYPLLGPGVFMKSNENTMVVHMNSFNDWRKCVEIPNIPVDKWFHVALVFRKSAMEVYINGNLSKKMPFQGGDVPYQNFGNVYVFNRETKTWPAMPGKATDAGPFAVSRQMDGRISRLNYFRYAIGFAEIRELIREEPSSKMEADSGMNRVPPYLQDAWWTTTY
jgi:hypothetical protein